MARTRKLLVGFDARHPDRTSSDFVVPIVGRQPEPYLMGIKNGSKRALGRMVFIGTEITARDLLAKVSVPDCDIDANEILTQCEAHLEMLQGFRIGNIISIESSAEAPGFRLVKKADTDFVFRTKK